MQQDVKPEDLVCQKPFTQPLRNEWRKEKVEIKNQRAKLRKCGANILRSGFDSSTMKPPF